MAVVNTFADGPEGWCSYEYHASMIAGANYFVLTTWAANGGVGDSGYVWADHTRWSTDAPERPVSILPLILYRNCCTATGSASHRSIFAAPSSPFI